MLPEERFCPFAISAASGRKGPGLPGRASVLTTISLTLLMSATIKLQCKSLWDCIQAYQQGCMHVRAISDRSVMIMQMQSHRYRWTSACRTCCHPCRHAALFFVIAAFLVHLTNMLLRQLIRKWLAHSPSRARFQLKIPEPKF